jgi:hypothetical protein
MEVRALRRYIHDEETISVEGTPPTLEHCAWGRHAV